MLYADDSSDHYIGEDRTPKNFHLFDLGQAALALDQGCGSRRHLLTNESHE
jgi:hypothetical protein